MSTDIKTQQKEKKIRVDFRLPKELCARMKKYDDAEGVCRTRQVEFGVANYLDSKGY